MQHMHCQFQAAHANRCIVVHGRCGKDHRGKKIGFKIDGGGGNGQCRKLGHGPTFIPSRCKKKGKIGKAFISGGD